MSYEKTAEGCVVVTCAPAARKHEVVAMFGAEKTLADAGLVLACSECGTSAYYVDESVVPVVDTRCGCGLHQLISFIDA